MTDLKADLGLRLLDGAAWWQPFDAVELLPSGGLSVLQVGLKVHNDVVVITMVDVVVNGVHHVPATSFKLRIGINNNTGSDKCRVQVEAAGPASATVTISSQSPNGAQVDAITWHGEALPFVRTLTLAAAE